MNQVTSNNPASWIEAVWEAIDLDMLTENERDEVCTAMAWITEDLGCEMDMETGELVNVR